MFVPLCCAPGIVVTVIWNLNCLCLPFRRWPNLLRHGLRLWPAGRAPPSWGGPPPSRTWCPTLLLEPAVGDQFYLNFPSFSLLRVSLLPPCHPLLPLPSPPLLSKLNEYPPLLAVSFNGAEVGRLKLSRPTMDDPKPGILSSKVSFWVRGALLGGTVAGEAK